MMHFARRIDPGYETTMIEKLFQESVAELSRKIAEAEESLFEKLIVMAGYEPIASDTAEWTKHISVEYTANGRKTVFVDGKPRWQIIQGAAGDGPPTVGDKITYQVGYIDCDEKLYREWYAFLPGETP